MKKQNKKTAIPISKELRKAIDKYKRKDETDDDCIKRKLKELKK